MIPYKLRAPKEADINFIFNSWLKSYRNSDFAKSQCNAVYFENHKQIVTTLINKSLIVVACSPDDVNHVFGYVVYQFLPGNNLLVHYAYVKHTYRRMGIAKDFISKIRKSDNPILSSHYAPIISKCKSILCLYDPYRMFNVISVDT